MDSLAGVMLLGVVSLLVGAGLFLFVLGLGLLRWAPFRRVLYLLPILLLATALVLAGAVQLCVYLVPDFTRTVPSAWAERLALLSVGGGSESVNLAMGLAFLGAGVLVGHLFYAASQDAVREGHRNRRHARQRQAVRLYTAAAGRPTRFPMAPGAPQVHDRAAPHLQTVSQPIDGDAQ